MRLKVQRHLNIDLGIWLSIFFSCMLISAPIVASNEAKPLYLQVSNTNELREALVLAKASHTGATIALADGTYEITGSPLKIKQDFIKLVSTSGIRENVILSGQGMASGVGTLIDVSADYFSIADITLRDAKWHLIQIRAEADADYFFMENCVLQDSGQQLLKVSHKKDGSYSDFGIIKNSLFEYTAGIGPGFYIGGIDAHKSQDWLVQDNVFKNISSPSNRVAEHAIHFWNDSKRINTIGNLILNSDRGIGYGLMDRENQNVGGIISGNIIVHNKPNNPFADVGIGLESSPNTKVINNIIYLNTDYPNAIEYRFARTQNVLIKNNTTNKAITSRNKGRALLVDNQSSSFTEEMIDNLKYVIKSKD